MELTEWQKELMEALQKVGLSREDILSVMLVLTREEKGRELLAFLSQKENPTPDEVCERAGQIAFGNTGT